MSWGTALVWGPLSSRCYSPCCSEAISRSNNSYRCNGKTPPSEDGGASTSYRSTREESTCMVNVT
jgi:hypothetical protein